jgi:hypothetical protein
MARLLHQALFIGPAARRRGQESGAQRMPGKRRCVEPGRGGRALEVDS